MDNVLLSVKNLCVEYNAERGRVHAVTDVSFDIHRGEFFGLAGESGCGKSTTAFAIMRLLKGSATIAGGEIAFNGKNVLQFGAEELRLFRWDQTSMVLQSAMNISETRLKSYPHELSGGMRQRVVIAMALALKPDLIIFDEPTTALDVVVQYNIIRKITALKNEMGFSILFITHDLPLMLEMCDRIGIMYAGRLMEVAPVEILKTGGAHPYSDGLLHAFPSLLGEKTRLTGIPGSVPDLITPPQGCLFYDRCSRRDDRCRQTLPAFERLGDRHFCACFNARRKGEA